MADRSRRSSAYTVFVLLLVSFMPWSLPPDATDRHSGVVGRVLAAEREQPPVAGPDSTWRQAGLAEITVFTLAVDPDTPSTLYAATDDGLYTSTDAGRIWGHRSMGSPAGTGWQVNSVVIDPNMPSILYIGAGGGIHKSVDAGRTWTWLTENAVPGVSLRGTTVAIDPDDTRIIYAGMFVADNVPSLYKSTDGGASWIPLDNGPPPGTWTYSLVIDPTDSDVVYAGMSGAGVYKTTNGGATWTAMNSGLPDVAPSVEALVMDPATPTTLYVGTSQSSEGGGIYKTTNGGQTWSPTAATGPDFGVSSLLLRPGTPHTFYAGRLLPRVGGPRSGGVITMQDGGASWAQFGDGLNSLAANTLAIMPGNPPVLFAGTDEHGVYRIELSDSSVGEFAITSRSPVPGSIYVDPAATIMAAANQTLDPSTVTPANVFLLPSGGTAPVPANLTYDSTTGTITLDPLAALAPTSAYQVTIRGGPSGIRSTTGATLQADVTWTFTTASDQPTPLENSVEQIGATGTYRPDDPRAPAGVYSIVFKFKSVSAVTFQDIVARITELPGGHVIVNRDRGTPPGVGALLSLPNVALGPDRVLSPSEELDLFIDVGLLRREPFRIALTGTGRPVDTFVQSGAEGSGAARRTVDLLRGGGEFVPEAPPADGPSRCAPRPKIDVRTQHVGPNQIEATITTEATAGAPNNALKGIRLTRLDNATVQVAGGPTLNAEGAFTPPPGAREVKLLVSRAQPGPMLAHLEIEDGCGKHPTFVGAGTGAR